MQSKILLIGVIILLLTGCQVSRMNKVMNARYKNQVLSGVPKQKNSDISINSTHVDTIYEAYAKEAKEGGVNALFAYAKLRNVWIYIFNPKIPVTLFTNAVFSNVNKGLKQKLAGRHLELSIDSIPSIFYFADRQSGIASAFGAEVASIQSCSCNKNMIVSYRLLSAENAEIKKGTILIPDLYVNVSLKMLQTFEGKMSQYFEEYDMAITGMTKKLIDKVIKEL